MSLILPEPINFYFDSELTDSDTAIDACFSNDAEVYDEGNIYVGLAAIKAWKTEAKANTRYTVEPLSVTELEGQSVVSAKVAGNFPNSPVILSYRFTVRNDRITKLEIS